MPLATSRPALRLWGPRFTTLVWQQPRFTTLVWQHQGFSAVIPNGVCGVRNLSDAGVCSQCRVCSTIPRLRGRKWASMRRLERAKRGAPTLFALWELAAQPQGWIIGAGSGESIKSGSVRAEGCDSPPLLDCTANAETTADGLEVAVPLSHAANSVTWDMLCGCSQL
jgi:hypothetical protein